MPYGDFNGVRVVVGFMGGTMYWNDGVMAFLEDKQTILYLFFPLLHHSVWGAGYFAFV